MEPKTKHAACTYLYVERCVAVCTVCAQLLRTETEMPLWIYRPIHIPTSPVWLTGHFCSHWAPTVAVCIHLLLGSNIHHSGQRKGVIPSFHLFWMMISLFVEVLFNNKPVTTARAVFYKARMPGQFDQTIRGLPFPCPAAREEIQSYEVTASECCTLRGVGVFEMG